MQMTVRSHYTSCRHPKKTLLLKSVQNPAVSVNTCILSAQIPLFIRAPEHNEILNNLWFGVTERRAPWVVASHCREVPEHWYNPDSSLPEQKERWADGHIQPRPWNYHKESIDSSLSMCPWAETLTLCTAPHSEFAWVGASAPLNLWNVCKWNQVVMSRLAQAILQMLWV